MDPVWLHGLDTVPPSVWVSDEANDQRVAVVWPSGFTVTFSPRLAMLDPDGRVVAREGDRLSLGGGFGSTQADGQTFFACQIDGTTYLPN